MYYEAFKKAVEEGNAGSLDIKTINLHKISYFQKAAQNGHLEVVKFLLEQALDGTDRSDMIREGNYFAFRFAASNGHLKVVKFLLEQVVGTERSAMIRAGDYYAFRWAAQYGHLEVVKFLLEQVNDTERSVMIRAGDYYAFREVAKLRRLDFVKYLVSISEFGTLPYNIKSFCKKTEIYLRVLESFREALKVNNTEKLNTLLNELFQIKRMEGKIVGINEENLITLNLVKKAIIYYQSQNIENESIALLQEISNHAEGQHHYIMEELNNYLPKALSELTKQYVPPVIMMQDGPSYEVDQAVLRKINSQAKNI